MSAGFAALEKEPGWPSAEGGRPVFLADVASGFELALIEAWIERHRPDSVSEGKYDVIRIPPTRGPRSRRRRTSLARLESCLASEDSALLTPLRVVWLARKRNGRRSVTFRDLFFGDPRDPGPLRQRFILRTDPERCRIVAGEPATVAELRERWQHSGHSGSGETMGLDRFVARQAELALERAERALRGARYKVPRLVDEDILAQPAFRGGLRVLARREGRSVHGVERRAARYLREIAATHSPTVIDLVARLIHMLYTRGYGEAIRYDRAELEGVKRLCQKHPVVFLPSHKSNLDHLVLQYALHDNGHPPNHTAGGINMNFFPVGQLVRRSGVFFIRRSFKDNEVYKFVLHHYIDYLIERRFSLEWYIEGGRSRSGKLLPPRFGLLAYVVDAYRRGKAEDVMLIPVSIAYDQVPDVGEYAAEQSGRPKEKESLSWFVGLIRRLGHRYGDIHFRFGEPISLAAAMGQAEPGAEPSEDESSLELQKLAFEVAVRINRVTPVTESSLVTLALLGVGDQAVTVGEATKALTNLRSIVQRRKLPHTGDLADLAERDGVQRALEALVENGVVSRFSEGPEPVYRIGPEEQLAAAYYRNTVIHFFVTPAIAELSLLRAADDDVADPLSEFWEEAMRMRNLLKFEFFFAEKDAFRDELGREVGLQEPEWESRVAEGPEAIGAVLRSFRPFNSHRVMRPFLEAYRLVSDTLEHLDPHEPHEPYDEAELVSACMGLGRQYHLQRRIRSTASVSQVLIRTALRLAANRDLLEPDSPGLEKRRVAFADEIRAALRRVDAIDALAASRRAGLID